MSELDEMQTRLMNEGWFPVPVNHIDVRCCQTCWAMIYRDYQQQHLDWHRQLGHEIVVLPQSSLADPKVDPDPQEPI